jgi:SAM-dependent methyltransferase
VVLYTAEPMTMDEQTIWPKKLPQLTAEQQRIRDDFMRHWHEVLPRRYSVVERFNQGYAARSAESELKTLEIGAGLGEHLAFEPEPHGNYWAVELREEMARAIERVYPGANMVVADCQQELPFEDGTFDRALAIHVLEHLPDLPSALTELRRVLKPNGRFVVVIPCEGGLAYTLARRISAQRIFERRYRMNYDWFVRSEHINLPNEIVIELEREFVIDQRSYFPLHIPSVTANLVIGLTLRPRISSSTEQVTRAHQVLHNG